VVPKLNANISRSEYADTASNATDWRKGDELKAHLVEAAVPEGARAAQREVEHLAVLVRGHPHPLLALHLHGKPPPQQVSSSKVSPQQSQLARTNGKSSAASAADKAAPGDAIGEARVS